MYSFPEPEFFAGPMVLSLEADFKLTNIIKSSFSGRRNGYFFYAHENPPLSRKE
jgi:hypothetical protein